MAHGISSRRGQQGAGGQQVAAPTLLGNDPANTILSSEMAMNNSAYAATRLQQQMQ